MNWIHPNSHGHNPVEQFPEIFSKYEFRRFRLSWQPKDRMDDFFASSSFLFGSIKNEDINMIFSAIQRLYGYEHVDFVEYILEKDILAKLLNISEKKDLKGKITLIRDDYLEKHGMKRQIVNFYQKFVTEQDKQLLFSKFFIPVSYKSEEKNDAESNLKLVIGILVDKRNDLDHAAVFSPFYKDYLFGSDRLHFKNGNKGCEGTIKLTFEDFYQITRKAMASFWLQEYETYFALHKEEIDSEIAREDKELAKLNV